MRLEDMKGLRKDYKREKDPEGRSCELVMRIVHVMFRDGTVP